MVAAPTPRDEVPDSRPATNRMRAMDFASFTSCFPPECLLYWAPAQPASWLTAPGWGWVCEKKVINHSTSKNCKHLQRKIPSRGVDTKACSSASQLLRLTTCWLLDLPNRYAPFNMCMPRLVERLWVWLLLQSESEKIQAPKNLSLFFHFPCPGCGARRRTQMSDVNLRYTASVRSRCRDANVGLPMAPLNSFTTKSKSGLSLAKQRHVPMTVLYA